MATNNIWQLSWNPKNYDTRGRMLAAAASEEKRNMIQSWGRSPITNISKIKTGDIVYISSKKNASAKLLSPSHFDSLPKLSLMNLSEIRMSMRSAMAIGGIVICVSLNFISGNIGEISAETKIHSAIQQMHFGKIKCRNS